MILVDAWIVSTKKLTASIKTRNPSSSVVDMKLLKLSSSLKVVEIRRKNLLWKKVFVASISETLLSKRIAKLSKSV